MIWIYFTQIYVTKYVRLFYFLKFPVNLLLINGLQFYSASLLELVSDPPSLRLSPIRAPTLDTSRKPQASYTSELVVELLTMTLFYSLISWYN